MSKPLAEQRGAVLRRARKALDKTQSTMARALDVHESTVALWESGARPMPGHRLDQLFVLVGDHEQLLGADEAAGLRLSIRGLR